MNVVSWVSATSAVQGAGVSLSSLNSLSSPMSPKGHPPGETSPARAETSPAPPKKLYIQFPLHPTRFPASAFALATPGMSSTFLAAAAARVSDTSAQLHAALTTDDSNESSWSARLQAIYEQRRLSYMTPSRDSSPSTVIRYPRLIVIDMGSYFTKFGFVGEAEPCAVRSLVGRLRNPGVFLVKGMVKDAYYVDEALAKGGICNLAYLDAGALFTGVPSSIASDWDHMEKIWQHIFYDEVRLASM